MKIPAIPPELIPMFNTVGLTSLSTTGYIAVKITPAKANMNMIHT